MSWEIFRTQGDGWVLDVGEFIVYFESLTLLAKALEEYDRTTDIERLVESGRKEARK